MGILSECLVLLIICQTLYVMSFEQEVQPEVDKYDMFVDFVNQDTGEQSVKKRSVKEQKEDIPNGKLNVNELNKDILKWHNYYRSIHQVPAVTYSTTLEEMAKQTVIKNVKEGRLDRLEGNPYGENQLTGVLSSITGQDIVKGWYDEMLHPGYNFRSQRNSGTGHFTQVVWKATKKIGCWTASHPFHGMTRFATACEYDPPGNMNTGDSYLKNVLTPKY